MHHRYRVWTGLLIVFMITSVCSQAAAEQSPFGEAPPEAKAPPKLEVPEPEDPAVQAVLETDPTTPSEMVRAAKILADLDRPDLARGFLKQVLDANLDPQQLVGLGESFGTGLFAGMASRKELAPEGRQLSDAVLTAVSAYLRDPDRLAGVVKQLQDPSAEVRSQALVELQRARGAAVGPLVAALADPSRAAEHANVRAALVKLDADATGPLTAMLEASEPTLVVEAIRLLAAINADEAAIFLLAASVREQGDAEVRQAAGAALAKLLGATPAKDTAVRLLAQRAEEHFARSRPLKRAGDQQEMWTWDDDAKQPVGKTGLADDASLTLAARLARDAYSLAPKDDAIRRLYLATMLEQAAYQNGLDKPLDMSEGTPGGRAAAMGVEVVEDLLVYALGGGHAPAATAAVRILGQKGKADSLLCQGSRPAPLVEATWNPDRRVRFAAVEAILALEPVKPFPGSSRVTEALGFFAASCGMPRALVAAPNTSEARRVAGYLLALGYQVDTAVTGRDVIRQLFASPDYELALVDVVLERPTVDLLVQQLRHDCRTARLPVGVVARAGRFRRAEHVARRDPLAEAFHRLHTQESAEWQVERLLGLLGRERVLPEERKRQAASALKWLADWTGREQKIFDFSRLEEQMLAAVYVPDLGLDAVAVLGNMRTRDVQETLVDLASRPAQPIELRAAAAQAFGENVRRNGILLTSQQILLQYDRYNQSETLDKATQQVLGSILDAIEGPSRAKQQDTENGEKTAKRE